MIVYDNSTMQSSLGQSSVNYNHTVGNGKNRVVIAGIMGPFGADSITSCQFGGVNMTQIKKITNFGNTNRTFYLYLLINPPIGTSAFTATVSSNDIHNSIVISYFGCLQEAPQPDASAVASNSNASSLVLNITTVADKTVVVVFGHCFGQQVSNGSGLTVRNTSATNNEPTMFDSGSTPLTPAGAKSFTMNATGSNTIQMLALSLTPAPEGGGGALLLMAS